MSDFSNFGHVEWPNNRSVFIILILPNGPKIVHNLWHRVAPVATEFDNNINIIILFALSNSTGPGSPIRLPFGVPTEVPTKVPNEVPTKVTTKVTIEVTVKVTIKVTIKVTTKVTIEVTIKVITKVTTKV